MTTPLADRLRVYYASKNVPSDDAVLPVYTADAGSDRDTIVDAALVEADGYWNFAHGFYLGDVTAALAGEQFYVRSFVTGALTLSRNSSVAAAAGDSYVLIAGGGFGSAREILGMLAGGVLPELVAVVGTNITGLTCKKFSGRLGPGTLTIHYDQAAAMLYAKMGSEAYGVGVDVSGNVTDGHVYVADGSAWVRFDTVAASLPVGDEDDTFTLAYPLDTHVPDYEGFETAESANGKSRYRLEVARNEDGGGGVMVGLNVNIDLPAGTATTIAGGGSLGLTAGALALTDASDHPTRGYWLYNRTKDDCRPTNYRSGNTAYCLGVDWGTLGFDQGSVEIVVGATITDATTAATAIVDQITVATGTWGGSDAAGTMILREVAGTFGNNNVINVGATPSAVCDGASVLGFRGFTAVSWAAADVIELMPDSDIGIGTAVADEYETPAAVTIAPAGVTFGVDQLELGHVGDGEHCGIWRREVIVAGHQARANVSDHTTYSCT